MTRLPPGVLTATVDGFTHGGEGVVRVQGKAVFVPGALPGERVAIEVVDDRRRWARARLVAVEVPSPDRVEPPCPYASDCGGCDLQHASVAGQLRLKTRVVTEQLERLGGIDAPPVAPAQAVGPALGYRGQARMHADRDGRLGFHRHGTNEVVRIDVCAVLTPATQSVRAAVGDDTGATEVTMRATTRGDRGVVLHPGPGPVALSAVPADLDVQLAGPDGSMVAVRGDGVVTERVADIDFDVDVGGFFQNNVAGAEALVDAVLDDVGDVAGQVAWDLYAGVGLFALPLARAGARVAAVEGDVGAVAHLAANADRAGLADRVGVHGDDVATFVARPPAPPPDLVVLDPPRTGAGPDVMAAITASAPGTIVYVACDPAALARDARALGEGGYRLRSARPFDLFPMTHHVEVVARFAP